MRLEYLVFSGILPPKSYFPERRPPLRGLHGSTAILSCSQSGMSSYSVALVRRLYCGCRLTNSSHPWERLTARDSASCQALKLLAPMYLTLPDLTRESRVLMVSSSGVSGSHACTWRMSIYGVLRRDRLCSTDQSMCFLVRPAEFGFSETGNLTLVAITRDSRSRPAIQFPNISSDLPLL